MHKILARTKIIRKDSRIKEGKHVFECERISSNSTQINIILLSVGLKIK